VLCSETNGELDAILPLVMEAPARRPWQPRILQFLGVPDTQLADYLASPATRTSAAVQFADALIARRHDWDVLRLHPLAPDAAALVELRKALLERGADCVATGATANAYIRLDAGWAQYLAGRSRSLKKAINLAANRNKRVPGQDIEWLEPGTTEAPAVERAIEAAVQVSSRSWKRGTGNSLDAPGPGAFIRRLSEHATRRGWLSIWTLRLDGVPIAMEYQLVADGAVYALRSDFDADHDQASPGAHLFRNLLERMMSGGLQRYWMGPGENAYKYRWADDSEPVHTSEAFSPTARGRVLGAWRRRLRPALAVAWHRLQGKRAAAPSPEEDAK
jgi:CelD/BcsL family acetyltransferase involved in cellulose biosynthesis